MDSQWVPRSFESYLISVYIRIIQGEKLLTQYPTALFLGDISK